MNTTDKVDLNSSITYENGTLESNNCIITPSWYRDYYYPVYYPTYVYSHHTETEIAFKVAKMLQEKKLVNLRTVKQFVDLVDELIKVL